MEIVSSVFKDFAKFCDALLNMVFLKAEICQWGGMHGVSRQEKRSGRNTECNVK